MAKAILLWMSRHTPTPEQLDDLKIKTLSDDVELAVVTENVTFAAKVPDAVKQITDLLEPLQRDNPTTHLMVSGVLPTHIALGSVHV